MSYNTLLAVSDLRKRFNLEAGFFTCYGRFVNAVNGVSFTINKNETYGLVGESGCGKAKRGKRKGEGRSAAMWALA